MGCTIQGSDPSRRDFSLPQNVQLSSRVHPPAIECMGGGEVGWALKLAITSLLVLRLKMGRVFLLSPYIFITHTGSTLEDVYFLFPSCHPSLQF